MLTSRPTSTVLKNFVRILTSVQKRCMTNSLAVNKKRIEHWARPPFEHSIHSLVWVVCRKQKLKEKLLAHIWHTGKPICLFGVANAKWINKDILFAWSVASIRWTVQLLKAPYLAKCLIDCQPSGPGSFVAREESAAQPKWHTKNMIPCSNNMSMIITCRQTKKYFRYNWCAMFLRQ